MMQNLKYKKKNQRVKSYISSWVMLKRWKHLGDILNCYVIFKQKKEKKGMSPLRSGGQTSLGHGEEGEREWMGKGPLSKLGLL